MLTLAFNQYKKVLNYFSEKPNEIENKFLAEVAKLEDGNQEEFEEKCKNVEGDIKAHDLIKECFTKKGVITQLECTYGYIDHIHYFNSDLANGLANLKIGCTVSYLAYKSGPDQTVQITKILSVIDEYWNAECTQDDINELISNLRTDKPEFFTVKVEKRLGKITKRDKDIIYGDDIREGDSFFFSINDVEINFVPSVGDQITLVCKVQCNEAEFDYKGDLLEVLSVEPTRSKTHQGEITFINQYYGVVDNELYFKPDALFDGFQPEVGTFVIVDAIECDYENCKYTWRCLKVILAEEDLTKQKIIQDIDVNSKSKSDTIAENNGISITENIHFRFEEVGPRERKNILVKNNNKSQSMLITHIKIIGNKQHSQLFIKSPNRYDVHCLEPGGEIEIVIEAKSMFYGVSVESLLIKFERFNVKRSIEIEVCDKDHVAPSIGTGPIYRKTQYTKKVFQNKSDFIPGERPVKAPPFVSERIPRFDIPELLASIVLDNPTTSEVNEALIRHFPRLNVDLNIQNYVEIFDPLIHLEEIQLFHNFRKHDSEHVIFMRENEYLALRMENVAEARPSIVIGDWVFASNTWNDSTSDKKFQGYVHQVLNNRILLKFDENFHLRYNGEGYRIRFEFSRKPFQKSHYAVRKVSQNLGQTFLFPTKIVTKNVQLDIYLNEMGELWKADVQEKLPWYNSMLNIVQKTAVKNILRGEARPMPYIIFGPPGTGKTITVIETIIQIVKNIPYSRLIIATPSNSSANLITERLIESGALQCGEFVRIIGQNMIKKETIPEHIMPYCITCDIALERTRRDNELVTASGVRLNCRKSKIGINRVTIGTCQTIGQLIYMGFAKNHFTHVIVDEAGQCLEPETMIPIMFLSKEEGQVILAGDPMQLGPIVLSPHAASRGYDTSFLRRILDRSPYQKDVERFSNGYDDRLITQLIYSYRAIPSVLKVYSDLFYNSSLVATISDSDSEEIKLLKSLRDILPNPASRDPLCGLYFHGVRGTNLQNSDSPSWFNPSEAMALFTFVLKLLGIGVQPSDIGIITPYSTQVRVIRKMFIDGDFENPKVGTVEEFQGQEKKIILLSTVRSVARLVATDKKYALGFVGNSRRTNVAISRAKSLIMIFGNPHLLSIDPNWNKIIKICVDKNTYVGCDLPPHLSNELEEE